MKIKLSKKEKYIISIIGLLIISLPSILTRTFQFGQDSAFVGDTLGGITAPFLGFFGSVLVYLALRAQIDANEQIQKQFEKQNNDQLFFRLIDGLNDKIVNYSTTKKEWFDKEEISSYDALPFIVQEFRKEMERECAFYGRHLLAKVPEQIDNQYYKRIIECSSSNLEYSVMERLSSELKNDLIEMSYNDRWEHIKSELNSNGFETDKQKNVLTSIGSVYFYKTSYNMRYDMYNKIFSIVSNKHGGLLITYFNTLRHLFNFINKIEDNSFYVSYLGDSLSSYEKALIFYFIADYTQENYIKLSVKKFDLIKYRDLETSFFVDVPSEEEFERELKNILDFDVTNVKD